MEYAAIWYFLEWYSYTHVNSTLVTGLTKVLHSFIGTFLAEVTLCRFFKLLPVGSFQFDTRGDHVVNASNSQELVKVAGCQTRYARDDSYTASRLQVIRVIITDAI